MPKIRDLGISFIPATMRPPEIGAGGGFYMAGCDHTKKGDCGNLNCSITDKDKDDHEGDCGNLNCSITDRDDDVDCGNLNCSITDRPHGGKREVAGFGRDAIAQLKQQLRSEMSREIQY
ncbi:MAG: hypothetical protein ACJ74H_21010 [Thermoanaerobaculia bacterium]